MSLCNVTQKSRLLMHLLLMTTLAVMLASCGGGGGQAGTVELNPEEGKTVQVDIPTGPELPASYQAAYDLVLADIQANPWRTEMTLLEKDQRIAQAAGCEIWTEETKRQPGTAYRLPNQWIVNYRIGLDLATVNQGRQDISQGDLSELAMLDGQSAMTGMVVADAIPASLLTAEPEASVLQPNATLLSNTDYVAFTRHLSQKYGVVVLGETYYLGSNMATIIVPDGVDEAALIKQIQRENNDVIELCEPNYMVFEDQGSDTGYDPRIKDSLCDWYGITGSGIAPENTGPAHWDSYDSYGLLQVNAHPALSSWAGHYPQPWAIPDPTSSVLVDSRARSFVLDTGFDGNATNYDMFANTLIPSLEMPPSPPVTCWDLTNYFYFFYDDRYENGYYGHGTQVASIISSRGDNDNASFSGGILGITPYGSVYPIKCNGSTFMRATAMSLALATSLEPTAPAVNVANCSFGRWDSTVPYDYSNVVLSAAATNPNFVFVCSAGNDRRPAHEHWPSGLAMTMSNVISVGGLDSSDEIALTSPTTGSCYSVQSYPDSVTICAPYGNVLTLTHSSNSVVTEDYGLFNGTSAAAPYVTGVVAMLQNQYPLLTAAQIRDHLILTGRNTYWDSAVPLPYFGDPLNPEATVTKPILDAGAAMPWINVLKPGLNKEEPNFLVEGTEIEYEFNLPEGILASSLSFLHADFYLRDENDPFFNLLIESRSAVDMPMMSPGYNTDSFVFHPDLFTAQIAGRGELMLQAELHFAGGLPLMPRKIPVYVYYADFDFIDPANPVEGEINVSSTVVTNGANPKVVYSWATDPLVDKSEFGVGFAPSYTSRFSPFELQPTTPGYFIADCYIEHPTATGSIDVLVESETIGNVDIADMIELLTPASGVINTDVTITSRAYPAYYYLDEIRYYITNHVDPPVLLGVRSNPVDDFAFEWDIDAYTYPSDPTFLRAELYITGNPAVAASDEIWVDIDLTPPPTPNVIDTEGPQDEVRSVAVGEDSAGRLHVAWFVDDGGHEIKYGYEQTPGAYDFVIYDNVEYAASGTGTYFTDISIGTTGAATGVAYQKHSSQPDEAKFAYRNGGSFTFITEAGADPYIDGLPIRSSFRVDEAGNDWYVAHIENGTSIERAKRPSPGSWSNYILGSTSNPTVNQLDLDLVQGTMYEPWRLMITSYDPWAQDDYDQYQLHYGNNWINNLYQYRVINGTGLLHPTWLSTAYVPGQSFCDMYYSPVVFTTQYNSLYPTQATQAVVEGCAAESTNWNNLAVEWCTTSGANDAVYHGYYGDAAYLPIRDTFSIAYHSGLQGTQQFTGDNGDLKLARYTTGGWNISTISTTPGGQDTAMCVRSDDEIVVVYPHKLATGELQMALWHEF